MNLQRREEISALLAEPVTGGAGQVLEYRDALMECRTHIDTLEQSAAERVIADGSRGPTPDYTGEGSAWVPPVEARAVVVPPDSPSKYRWRSVLDMIPKDAWLICIDTDARIFYAKQGPRSGGWTFHGAHAFRDPTHWLDVIPENRLLRDGMVQVPERELACMRAELEYRRAASEEAPESVLDPLWDAFDALRANQGGTAT